ncbi:MAG: hypothetical protein ACM3Q1_10105 [Bacteroidales bacterium]
MARKAAPLLLVLSEDESAALQGILDAAGAVPEVRPRWNPLATAAPAVLLLAAGAAAALLLIPDPAALAGQWFQALFGR